MLIDSATEPLHGGPAGFQHDAFVYADDEDFVRRTAPFVRAGLEADEVNLVAVPRRRLDLLRDELADCAADVTFVDMADAGRNPARIIPLWRDLLDDHPGRPVRGIGEPVYVGRSPEEIQEAKLHEALLNVAFEHDGPFRLRCPYEASIVSPGLGVHRNHPVVLPDSAPATDADPTVTDPTDAADPAGRSWVAIAQEGFRVPLPAVPEAAERWDFGAEDLTDLRAWAAARARAKGLAEERNDDLALALHEVCTNSIRFGGGRGTLSLWQEGGSLVCEVADRGYITDVLVGRVLPPATQEGGRGVWLANQLCDLVQIRTAPGSTQVRLHTALTA